MPSFSDRGPGIDKLRAEGDVKWLASVVARRRIVEREGRVFDLAVPLRLMAIEALAEIGNDEARKALTSALRDPQDSVRRAAARAIKVHEKGAATNERPQPAAEAVARPERLDNAEQALRTRMEEVRRDRDEAASLLKMARSRRREAEERADRADKALSQVRREADERADRADKANSQARREAEQRTRRQVEEARREGEQRGRAEAKKRLEAKIAKLRQERDDAASAHKTAARELREAEKEAEEQARKAHREAGDRVAAALRKADERVRDAVERVRSEAEERASAEVRAEEQKLTLREDRLRRERDEVANELEKVRLRLRAAEKETRRQAKEAKKARRNAGRGLGAEVERLRHELDAARDHAAVQLEFLELKLAEERHARRRLEGVERKLEEAEKRASAAVRRAAEAKRRSLVRPPRQRRSGEGKRQSQSAPKRPPPAPLSGPINLNEATLEDLRELQMSMTQAKRVLTYREQSKRFDSVDDLESLPGFSKAFLAEIKRSITT